MLQMMAMHNKELNSKGVLVWVQKGIKMDSVGIKIGQNLIP